MLLKCFKRRTVELTDATIEYVIIALESKAARIADGCYGEEDQPGDDKAWIEDLLGAADLLRARNFRGLAPGHLAEIRYCYGSGDGVFEEIKRLSKV